MKRKSISVSEPLSFAFDIDIDNEKSTRIRFGVVEVREYNIVPSFNPGGTSGVAIELGWSYIVNQKMPIDNFEELRSKERSSNFIEEKRLTELERETLLKRDGATDQQIQQAAKRSAIIRNQRRKSIQMMQCDTLVENLEHGVDIVKRSVMYRSRSCASGGAEYLRKKKIRCISEDDYGYRTTCIKLYDVWGI